MNGPGLFERVLGDAWEKLDPTVRAFHESKTPTPIHGRFTIEHARGLMARLAILAGRLPRAGTDVPTTLKIDRVDGGEIWRRQFGDSRLFTRMRARDDGFLVERVGLVECYITLDVQQETLVYQSRRAYFALGPVRVPLPRLCAPCIEATEAPGDEPDRVRVEVRVSMPITGTIMTYTGEIGVERRQAG